MALYCVGDIHGCYNELKQLLKVGNFQKNTDELLLTGDLIGRGPKPLDVLNFVMDLGDKVHVVLGNHDTLFLAVASGLGPPNMRDAFDDLLNSPQLSNIVAWYRQQPLLYFHPNYPLCLVHAGIAPQWDLQTAKLRAQEVETILQDDQQYQELLRNMYSDQPNKWDDKLQGIDRYRFILNVFTRIRFCTVDKALDFANKNTPEVAIVEELYPWFTFRDHYNCQNRFKIVFGHWAALSGKCTYQHAIALDTGCVWGNHLTMWEFDTDTMYSVPSQLKRAKF